MSSKMDTLWAVAAMAATAAAAAGGAYFAINKATSLKEVWDNISVVGDRETALTAEIVEIEHIELGEDEEAAPDVLLLKATIDDDGKGALRVCLRLNGIIATASCESPEWRRNKTVVVRLFASGLFSKLTDLSADSDAVPLNGKVLTAIRSSLQMLLA